jgi:hypothetical protein
VPRRDLELLLTQTLLLREELVDHTLERERTEVDYHRAIRRLHAAGETLRWIADQVRLSHQRVHQIVSNSQRVLERQRRKALPFKQSGTPWSFSEQTSAVIESAHLEACGRGHPGVDVEHLLLSIVRAAEEPTASALASLRIDETAARSALVHRRPDREPLSTNHPTRIEGRARVATELARREADSLKSKQLEPEHLLMGLALVADAVEDGCLRDAGLTASRTRSALRAEPAVAGA